jgi:hypothetical protein
LIWFAPELIRRGGFLLLFFFDKKFRSLFFDIPLFKKIYKIFLSLLLCAVAARPSLSPLIKHYLEQKTQEKSFFFFFLCCFFFSH